ncbi:MAG: type II toxin-antitoxin system RelE/ParE family toxin [Verrucomicrobiota bacterium]
MRLVFHPQARDEFTEATLYYESKQAGLGKRFMHEVRSTTLRLPGNLELFRVVEQDIRKCRVPRFPYGLIFRPKMDTIEIIAVMSLHRKPGYWQDRIE